MNLVTVHSAGIPDPEQSGLRAPESLAALYRHLWDHDLVATLASSFPTWEELARADYARLAHLLGPRTAAFTLPDRPDPTPDLPAGAVMVSRYAMNYPADLREVEQPPCVLYVRGELPFGPSVGVGGAEHPSPQGVEISRAAAFAAAGQRRPVVVLLSKGVGVTALQATVDAGGKAVVVLPHGIDQNSRHQSLLEQVIELGGAVVTEVPPGIGVTEQFTLMANRIVTALSHAVVLAEVGRHVSAGALLARATIRSGRYLIVPTPQQAHIPETALGLSVLTQTRAFTSDWFGTSPRIDSRVANGLSPADAVVTDQVGIANAIAVACRAT